MFMYNYFQEVPTELEIYLIFFYLYLEYPVSLKTFFIK